MELTNLLNQNDLTKLNCVIKTEGEIKGLKHDINKIKQIIENQRTNFFKI